MEWMTDWIRVGSQHVTARDALRWAEIYLEQREHESSYPAYDGYRAGQRADPLDGPDLLAPVLLNVPLTLQAYHGLDGLRENLNAGLAGIPSDANLEIASCSQMTLVGRLFGVLDRGRPPGVRATLLTKILHRKRPGLIPLYDRQVRACYQTGREAPVPLDPDRSWENWIILVAQAMKEDLLRHQQLWLDITKLARTAVPITPLRALDIVAWHAGQAGGSGSGEMSLGPARVTRSRPLRFAR
jgi:hypothetical protein